MKLKDICKFVNEKVDTSSFHLEDYVSTENLLPNKGGVTVASKIPQGKATLFKKGDILISNIRPYFKKIYLAKKHGCCSNDVLCIRPNSNIPSSYLYYLLSQDSFFDYVMTGAKGTKMPRGDKGHIMNWAVYQSTLSQQQNIAEILTPLDDKIAVNSRICANLEAQAEALFKSWFVDFTPFKDQPFVDSELGSIPQGWKVGKLTDIAVYLNGLAMQKFPPQDIKDSFPVLKIKELGAGICDNSSDRCSNKVPKKYIIEDGDIIFSWSGTLMVDVWCGGQCGLNQHLFKVSSSNYPKWFYYHWTKKHLRDFIHIARDKAVTMGHIKRGHLDNALVVVPNNFILEKATQLFEPLLNMVISKRIENQRLAALRDTLLPKLMSGEIKL